MILGKQPTSDEQGAPSEPQAVIDAIGRKVTASPRPQRIVSLVPSVTEALFDLELGDRVVGCTDYCISPATGVHKLFRVGGPKTVNVEAVLKVQPDLILANQEENDREQVEALIQSGLRLHLAFPKTVEDAARFLEDLGVLTGAEARARNKAKQLRSLLATPTLPPMTAACLIWLDPLMVAGGNTLTSQLMAAAGFHNIFNDHAERYPQPALEDLATAAPRVLLLPTDPYPFTAEDAAALQQRLPGTQTVVVKGEWLTWYGMRMPLAIAGLRQLRERLS